MAESTKTSAAMSWPVIVNSTLQKSELCKILQTQHKVKVSESTVEGSCIFPLSSVAFLILYMSDILPQLNEGEESDSEVFESVAARLEKFINIHRCPFAVCIAPMFGDRELSTFCSLQEKYIEAALQFLPAHNEQECVEVMNTVAKAHCKPASDVLKTRLKSLEHGLLNSDETRDVIFAQLPVSQHERQILQDTLHSIENVSVATEEDFLDYTSLDRESIKAVISFFQG